MSHCRQPLRVQLPRTSCPRPTHLPPTYHLTHPQGSFFSMCSLVLRASVVSLRLHTLCSADPHFLLAIGTLTALTELKMGVSLQKGECRCSNLPCDGGRVNCLDTSSFGSDRGPETTCCGRPFLFCASAQLHQVQLLLEFCVLSATTSC